MERTLVTGGGGFIESHLASHLCQQGHFVLVADIKFDDYIQEKYYAENLKYDLRKWESCLLATKGIDMHACDARTTRYQVEHIAGVRGSRTRHIPPRCDTLRTHGICITPDEICKEIRHPLAYYGRKLKAAKTQNIWLEENK